MESQKPLFNICNAIGAKLHQHLPSFNITNPFRLFSSHFHSLLLLSATPSQDQALHRAEATFHTLQKWYNASTGLYSTTGWWNSANILTTVSNLAILDLSLSTQIELIIENTLVQAPKWNSQLSGIGYHKIIDPESMLVETVWDQSMKENEIYSHDRTTGNGFLNDYYDDEGWWALAWIQAYDLTSKPEYLQAAVEIFEDMKKGETTPCGGIWWSKSHTYVNAIANELYLSVAAHLTNRVHKGKYLTTAVKQWNWFLASGMINNEGTINDGLKIVKDGECRNNNGTVWSYNQGVILSALSELYLATSDKTYLDTAIKIAKAAARNLASGKDGVLHDPCENNGCGADGVQFKGVFMRGLMRLLEVLGEEEGLRKFVKLNAKSIWKWDRNQNGELGVVWSGPLKEVNAGSHGSGLDALVAAVAVENSRRLEDFT